MGGRILYKGLIVLSGVFGLLGGFYAEKSVAAHFNPQYEHFNVIAVAGLGARQDNIISVTEEGNQTGAGAEKFVQSMADQAIGFLSNSGMGEAQKKEAFRRLLSDSFDMQTIGRFSLGRYWRVSTPEQRSEYQKLFEKMVIDVYSMRFSEYEGQRFETRGFRNDGSKDTIVTSYIVPDSGPEVEVEWRVRYKKGSYKVVDVIVEGVSMSVTQRSDFSSVIQRGGGNVQVLIDHLRSL